MTDIEKRAIDYQNQFKVYNKACSYLINRGFTNSIHRDLMVINNRIGVSLLKNDYYYGYLVFPIINHADQIVSFTGRSIMDGITPPHKHWYGSIDYFYNHNTLRHYNAGHSLYHNIYITESPLDTLSLEHKGFYSIANLGSSGLPTNYVDLKNTKVIILFDTDLNNIGQSKAKKLASKLYPVCSNVKIGTIPLPNGHKKIDVNDLLKKYQHKFRSKIFEITKTAIDYIPEPVASIKYTSNHDFSGYDILDIVSEHVDLQQIGGLYRAYCPFHNDSDPSFTVYPQTSSFYCFGCGKGGDAAAFLQEIMGFEFKEAKEYLEINY